MSDRATYEAWVRAHHAAVYRAAHRVLRDVDDAMEVTQEVFLDALRDVPGLRTADDPGRVLRWKAVKRALMRIRGEGDRKST
ncbi:MAG: RNA polymerase sigma factor, partial [Planctomycetota bacterium JB042]